MTAAALSAGKKKTSGLRPINPRRDMQSVADLIEAVFVHDMDPLGTRMVREMRAYGKAGWVGYLLGRLLLPATAYPQGFVWVEENEVVGNASLLRVDGFTYRWVLANVAVAEKYRRRGIGRKLTQASIDFAFDQGAKEVFLQVESTNQAAQVLYASLGFRPLITLCTWAGTKPEFPLSQADVGEVRERRSDEWTQQLALAERLHPEGLVWPYPLTPRLFRESLFDRFMRSAGDRHWVWKEGDQLLGSATVRYRTLQGQWRIMLMVDPNLRGTIEKYLLRAILNPLSAGRREMILDYPAGIAEGDLRELGFNPRRTLTWMALRP